MDVVQNKSHNTGWILKGIYVYLFSIPVHSLSKFWAPFWPKKKKIATCKLSKQYVALAGFRMCIRRRPLQMLGGNCFIERSWPSESAIWSIISVRVCTSNCLIAPDQERRWEKRCAVTLSRVCVWSLWFWAAVHWWVSLTSPGLLTNTITTKPSHAILTSFCLSYTLTLTHKHTLASAERHTISSFKLILEEHSGFTTS